MIKALSHKIILLLRYRIRTIRRPPEIYLSFSNPNTYHTDYISGYWEQQSDHSLWPYWIKSERDSIWNSCDDFQLDIPNTQPSLPILRPSKNKCCVSLMSSCIALIAVICLLSRKTLGVVCPHQTCTCLICTWNLLKQHWHLEAMFSYLSSI